VDERGATVTMERPALAGFYSLRVPGGEQDTFAINRVARESDLQCISRDELGKILPEGKWSWVGPNEDMIAALVQARQGVELWRQLLAAALVLMLAEVLLAQWFGRRA
jgi:hypothetical protein